MGKGVAYLVAWIVGLVVVGWVAISLLQSFFFPLLIGLLVVGGGVYLYRRAKRGIAPGSRTAYRIEAAKQTYRMRDR